MKFIVHTDERVTGTYLVEADGPEEASAKFGDPKIDWSCVEQLDYQAYACEVADVAEVKRG